MVTLQTSFEPFGAAVGDSVDLANHGGDPFTGQSTPAGTAMVFARDVPAAIASGATAAKIITVATGNIYRQWPINAADGVPQYFRLYFYLPALPAAAWDPIGMAAAGVTRGRFRISPAGLLAIAGTTTITATGPNLTAGVRYRLEGWFLYGATAQAAGAVYAGDSLNAVQRIPATALTWQGTGVPQQFRLGSLSNNALTTTPYVDDVGFSDTAPLGPVGPATMTSRAVIVVDGRPTATRRKVAISRGTAPVGLAPAGRRLVVRPRVGRVLVGLTEAGRTVLVRRSVATLGLGLRPAGRRLRVGLSVATVRLGLTEAGRATLVRRVTAGLGLTPTGRTTQVRPTEATVGLGVVPAARTGLVRTATATAGLGLRPATPGLVVRFSRALLALFGAGPTGTARRVDARTGTVTAALTGRGVWSETDLMLARTGLTLGAQAATQLVRFVTARLPVDPDLGGRSFSARDRGGGAAVELSVTAIGAPLAARTAALTLALTPAGGTRDPQYDRDVTVSEVGRVSAGRTLVLGEVRAQ